MASQQFRILGMLPSLNEYSNNRRIRMGKQLKDRLDWELKAAVLTPIAHYPIKVHAHFTFRDHRSAYDLTNTAAAWKLIEDGLVRTGILRNDTLSEINHLSLSAHISSDESVGIQVTLYEPG